MTNDEHEVSMPKPEAGPVTTLRPADHDTLPELLARIRAASGTPIHLEIPPGSPLLLTATEFRALRATADRLNVPLTISTDDPLRQQFAAIFEFGDSPATAVQGESPSQTTRANGETPHHLAATPQAYPGATERSHAEPTTEPGANLPASRRLTRHLTRRLALILAAAAGALLTLGLIAAFFALPIVTVDLTLAKQSVTADLIFTAGPDAAPADGVAFTLPAAPVTGAVRIETSIPTTGERLVPDTPAGGPVVFSNPTDQEITVPRGTALSSDAGVDYAVTEDLSVPAAANDTPGYATGAVTATQPGTAGNLEIGDLSGRLELGVYFSNREAPIEGGTDRAVQVVSAADLEALRSNAEADITEQAVETLGAGLTPGAAVIAESINLEGLAFEFDRDEGDEATRVGVVATANATGLSYDAQQARADATDALEIELAATAPDGYELAPSTVQLEEPVPLDVTADGARFQVTANAAAVVILPNRDEIAGELAGKDHDAATALVRELPGVERAEITYQPGWWPQRMPRLSRQIDVATHP